MFLAQGQDFDTILDSILYNFQQILDEIDKKVGRKVYIAFLGDMADMITKNSVGNLYFQKMPPEDQIEIVKQLIKKFKDRIIGMVSGNHDFRMMKEAGFDYLKFIAKELDIPYSPTLLTVVLECNGFDISIALHHGVSGGRSKAASVRQNEYFLSAIQNVDIYVTGHTHTANITSHMQRLYDKDVVLKPTKLITVSSFLHDEDYALQKLLPPTGFDIPVATCYIETRRIKMAGSEIIHTEKIIDASLVTSYVVNFLVKNALFKKVSEAYGS